MKHEKPSHKELSSPARKGHGNSQPQHQQSPSSPNNHNNNSNTSTSTNNSQKAAYKDAAIFIETRETKTEWQLTWPIWHMLPRDERKAIAVSHGMKTIGEFEEYMSLHKAEELSAAMSVAGGGPNGTQSQAYANASMYNNSNYSKNNKGEDVTALEKQFKKGLKMDSNNEDDDRKLPAKPTHSHDEEDDDDDSEDEILLLKAIEEENQIQQQGDETLTQEELIEQGGSLLLLPSEIHHKILSYLEVDYYSLCALVHPTWAIFTRNEQTYQILCHRLYLKQSKQKKLRVQKFRNSYWNMLMTRPRVRTGTGFYILKYRQVKKIQRDMWTEIPVGAILETVYYRYLYFFENGRVLYALTTSSPLEMVGRIRNMIRYEGRIHNYNENPKNTHSHTSHTHTHHGGHNDVPDEYKDKHLVWGRYEVSKYDIQVRAKHSWCNVILDLQIVHDGNHQTHSQHHKMPHYPPPGGKFCTLAMVRHRTSTTVDFDECGFGDEKKDDEDAAANWWFRGGASHNIVEHDVPAEYFRFVRDWRL